MLKLLVIPALIALASFIGEVQASAQSVPDNPTSSELKELLGKASKGTVDPREVIDALSKPDGRFVPTMRELLFSQRMNPGSTVSADEGSTRPSYVPMPAHRILIKALENVGSSDCYMCVYDAVTKHPDPQIRGLCLNSLANSFQPKATTGFIKPDKQLIYLLLHQASDTLAIDELGKRVGDIAREGLKNWTAKGGSRPVPATLRINADNKSASTYLEHWWSRRSSRIAWDPIAGLFVLPL
jgi:hypothetical protein